MGSQEGAFSIKPPLFNGTSFVFWKFTMRAFLQALGVDVWEIIKGGYQYPTSILTDIAGKRQYETNAMVINTILGSISKSEFVKFMQLNTAKVMCNKLIQSY